MLRTCRSATWSTSDFESYHHGFGRCFYNSGCYLVPTYAVISSIAYNPRNLKCAKLLFLSSFRRVPISKERCFLPFSAQDCVKPPSSRKRLKSQARDLRWFQ